MRTLEFDARDREILAERETALNEITGLRVGDYVRFADGVLRRISYLWEWGEGIESVQTSDGGSFYLGDGYVSFSGSLYTGIPPTTLTLTEETLDGSVWFFHHDFWTAGGGVDTSIPFRVYECSLPT